LVKECIEWSLFLKELLVVQVVEAWENSLEEVLAFKLILGLLEACLLFFVQIAPNYSLPLILELEVLTDGRRAALATRYNFLP